LRRWRDLIEQAAARIEAGMNGVAMPYGGGHAN